MTCLSHLSITWSVYHHPVSTLNPAAERGQVLLNAFGGKKVSPEEVGNLSKWSVILGILSFVSLIVNKKKIEVSSSHGVSLE